MHLINVKTLDLERFVGSAVPPYAILSHTWGDSEVSFQDLSAVDKAKIKKKDGYKKIRYTCHQAFFDGLEYAWIDTCKYAEFTRWLGRVS